MSVKNGIWSFFIVVAVIATQVSSQITALEREEISSIRNKMKEVAATPQRPKNVPEVAHDANGIIRISPLDLISQLLNSNPGVFLGDRHGQYAITEFLTDNVDAMKKIGVTTLFIEMLKSADQGLIDQYSAERILESEKEFVAKFLPRWNIEELSAIKYARLIAAAKRAGITVRGIDIPNSGQTRIETSNPHWVSVISSYLQNNPLGSNHYLIFGGPAHAGDFPYNKGVDYILGIPMVEICTESSPPVVKIGRPHYSDFIITLNPTNKSATDIGKRTCD